MDVLYQTHRCLDTSRSSIADARSSTYVTQITDLLGDIRTDKGDVLTASGKETISTVCLKDTVIQFNLIVKQHEKQISELMRSTIQLFL